MGVGDQARARKNSERRFALPTMAASSMGQRVDLYRNGFCENCNAQKPIFPPRSNAAELELMQHGGRVVIPTPPLQ
jgi:hypothetical protein